MISRTTPLLWIICIAITVLLFSGALWFGDLNQDEGWYLYSGRMVAEGNLPFIDFASTQGPLMSLVYACAWPLVERWGVAGGRLFTAIVGLACMIAASCLAVRLTRVRGQEAFGPDGNRCSTSGGERDAGEPESRAKAWKASIAALVCFIFLGINVHQVYFFTIVKTYSLSGLLLVLGFLALTYVRGRRGNLASFICGVLLAMAAGVRLSAVVMAPVVFLVLLCSRSFSRRAPAFSLAAGVLVAGCAVFLPFAFKAPEAFRFGLLEYHAGREVGGIFNVLAYKAGFIARITRAYFVPLTILLVALVCGAFSRTSAGSASAARHSPFAVHRSPLVSSLWLSVLAVSLIHFLVSFPYDDYQVMIFPLFAAALAVMLIEMLSKFRVPGPELLVLVLICLNSAAAFSSPVVQSWFIGERDRIWWPLKRQTPLQRLREGAQLVRSLAGPDGTLLTQDTYLAVEAGLKVPEGLELGPFSYFPGWPRARADACHVLNRESMRELLLTTDAPVAAFSGYGLAIESPAVTPLSGTEQRELWQSVNERYVVHSEMENFGQAATRLRVLVRETSEW